jgi:hypothetical protein
MKPMIKKKLDLSKVRTRYEPPTLEEAVFAAQGLTDHIEHQVAIASELTGKPHEDVRPVVQRMTPFSNRSIAVDHLRPRRPIVVEKRSPRALAR